MTSGLVSNFTNLPASCRPQRSSLHPFHSRELHSFNSRTFKWPSLHCSSAAFITRTVVEERGFYALHGISEEVNFDEIKKAYKQLERKYHPDVSPPDMVEEYTTRFIEVREAYETLSGPDKRAAYDTDLAMGLHSAFSTRRRSNDRSQWTRRWQCQVLGLKRRSTMNEDDSAGNLFWGARMRRQNTESSRKRFICKYELQRKKLKLT